jgi:hypothetical protein
MNYLETSANSVPVPAVPDIVDVIPNPIYDDNTVVSESTINILNVYKTVVTHLISFEIIIIRVIPYTMASIDIVILTDKGNIYRTVNLIGPHYLLWSSSDGYLFDFIKENLDTIY